MVVISRFTVQDLDDPTPQQYREWKGQLVASITSIPNYLAVHNTAMAGAGGGGGPPIAPVFLGPGQDMGTSVGVLFAAAYAAMRGNAPRLVTQHAVTSVEQLIYALGDEFDRRHTIDENTAMAEFNQERFDDTKMELRQWISQKYQKMLLCPNLIPAAARNGSMIYALTMLLPPAFDEVCNRARVEQGLTWQDVRDRLVDYDKACPKAKREQQNRALVAQITNSVTNRVEQAMNARIDERAHR